MLFARNALQSITGIKIVDSHQKVLVKVLKKSIVQLGRRRQLYLHYLHEGQRRSVRIDREAFDAIGSDSTTYLLHLSQYEDTFLPLNYDARSQLISFLIFLVLFLISIAISIVRIIKN